MSRTVPVHNHTHTHAQAHIPTKTHMCMCMFVRTQVAKSTHPTPSMSRRAINVKSLTLSH